MKPEISKQTRNKKLIYGTQQLEYLHAQTTTKHTVIKY